MNHPLTSVQIVSQLSELSRRYHLMMAAAMRDDLTTRADPLLDKWKYAERMQAIYERRDTLTAQYERDKEMLEEQLSHGE